MKNLWLLFWVSVVLAACGNSTPKETVLIDGSNGTRPLVEALVEAYRATHPKADIQVGTVGYGSKERLDVLESGRIQIAMASHGLDEAEILRRGMEIHHIAQMAVVFGVHESVSIKSLSKREICDIFTGKLSNWEFTDMYSLKIVPLMRPLEEVDTEVAQEAIPCLREMKLEAPVQVKESSGDLARALATTSGAIGLTNMIRVAQSEGKIRALAINGMLPSAENIRSGKYPMFRNNYLITRTSASEAVRDFLSFVSSPAGIRVIEANSAFFPGGQ